MTPNNNHDGGSVLQQNEGRWLLESSGGGGGHVVVDNNNALKKGPWTAAEDQILMEYVRKHGEGNWNSVQRNSGLNRCGKSCRLRWANHLRPNLKKGAFSPEEERLILDMHAKYGNKWARMASHLPGRTDNEIKNYWNTRIKKRQRQGLPLYPHDINSHSHSNSQPTTTTLNPLPPNTNGTTQTVSFGIQSPTQANYNPSLSPTPPSLSPLSTPHQLKPNTLNSLPLFDPTTTTTSSFSSSTPSSTFHHPAQILGAPLPYKRCRDSVGFSSPILPNLQRRTSIFRTSSMPDIASFQLTGTNSMPNTASFQFSRTLSFPPLHQSQFQYSNCLLSPTGSVYSVRSELPSNQVSQTQSEFTNNTNVSSVAANSLLPPTNSFYSFKSELPLNQLSQTQSEITSTTNVSSVAANSLLPPTNSFYSFKSEIPLNQVSQTQSEITVDTNVSPATTNETHRSNGLLDDLLQEVDALAYVGGNNSSTATGLLDSFEEKHMFDGDGQCLQSTSSMESSLLESKPVQGGHRNFMPEDFSEPLNFVPSPEPVSDWYSDSGGLSNFDSDMQLSMLMDRSRVVVTQYS